MDVLAFDVPGSASPEADRDRAMAIRIEQAMAADPDPLFLILVGTLHARQLERSPLGDHGPLMAHHLEPRNPVTLDMRHAGGTAWICTSDGCGDREIPGNVSGDGSAPRITLWGDGPDSRGYDGAFHVGSVTASPPLTASLPSR